MRFSGHVPSRGSPWEELEHAGETPSWAESTLKILCGIFNMYRAMMCHSSVVFIVVNSVFLPVDLIFHYTWPTSVSEISTISYNSH